MGEPEELPTCGIIMPISPVDGCSEEHWREVRDIISDAIETAGLTPHLVSDADDVGIIQKRIIQNLYENPIVVCDVSGKNPNVMFELGLRLAFDKPTIIVKDDKTAYSFDTSPIEHLEYPRDLRFTRIVEFKEELVEKIKGTLDKAAKDKNYTTFLKHFGTFKVAKLDTEEVSGDALILEELRALRELLVSSNSKTLPATAAPRKPRVISLCLRDIDSSTFTKFWDELKAMDQTGVLRQKQRGPKHHHIDFDRDKTVEADRLLKLARKYESNARWLPPPKYV